MPALAWRATPGVLAAFLAGAMAWEAAAQVAVPLTELRDRKGASPDQSKSKPPIPMMEVFEPEPITPDEYMRRMRARQGKVSIPPERSRPALEFNLIAPKPDRKRDKPDDGSE